MTLEDQARELADSAFIAPNGPHQRAEFVTRTLSALRDAKEAGRREALAEAAEAVCAECARGDALVDDLSGEVGHLFRGHLFNRCDATSIRALIKETT